MTVNGRNNVPEQLTTPPERESARPRTDWDIGKAMGGLFSPPATEKEQDEELDTGAAPRQDTAEPDEQEDEDLSGDEDADPDASATSAEPFLVLTVEGKSIPVGSKEEAIALAQKGTHYTQEMQRLRETQRQWEAERDREVASVRQKEDQYATALKQLDETYGFVLGKSAPDWNSPDMQKLKTEKPNDYMALRDQWDQLGAIRSELGRLGREKQEKAQKDYQAWLDGQQKAITEKRPEWSDAVRRQQDLGLIREYALTQGISDQEIGNLFDHRFWMILHDAARYRQAEAAGKSKRATPPTSKTAAPGTGRELNQGDRRVRAERERLQKTGDVRAAGNILQDLMTRPRK